jgi:DNA-binding NtrC family response regulator
MPRGILIVEDEDVLANNIKRYLDGHGYEAKIAGTGAEGLQEVEAFKPDLALLDFHLPDINGLDILKKIRIAEPAIKVILITGQGNVQLAVDAMKAGAYDYLQKPLVLSELKLIIDRALKLEVLEENLSYYRRKEAERSGIAKILGESPAIKLCKQRIGHLLEGEESLGGDELPAVLITGETGTGKELVARAIHFDGKRREGPFVEINCASIPVHLVESELFGFERGAFTDARKRKLGLAESAEGGTLFLDEIGDMELSVQAKLLRMLEDRTVRRLGSVRDHKVNVRIIAATNQPLESLVKDAKFRSDLYYRLKVFNIDLPPLRERGGDIFFLAQQFLETHGQRYGRPHLKFSSAAREDLLRHSWPGNIRELRNTIEQAILLTNGNIVERGFLPRHSVLAQADVEELGPFATNRVAAWPGDSMKIKEVERALILRALGDSRGNVSRAAEVLGISRDTLRYRIDKYSLRSSEWSAVGRDP